MIANGENSGVEFKRDVVEGHEVAKELVAFLNLGGGTVLLGVEDDGTIAGITRAKLDEWVSEICRTKVDPPVIPFLQLHRDVDEGKAVYTVTVPAGPSKPYARVHDRRRTYFVRVGSTSREASQDELIRISQSSGRFRFGLTPVPGSSIDDLDSRRLGDYLLRVLGHSSDPEADPSGWVRLLHNLELLTDAGGTSAPTADAMLLFGRNPKRFLPQSGIRATAYPGTEQSYETVEDGDLRGPLLPLFARDNERGEALTVAESGLVEQALSFIERVAPPTSRIVSGRREDRHALPAEVLREAVVNALVHRDYSVAGAEIMLSVFADRVEVKSPGALPNAATVEAVRDGFRYSRNQTLVTVMRDYRYVDARGMGIRQKIIPLVRAHSGRDPDLVATAHDFTLRLWR